MSQYSDKADPTQHYNSKQHVTHTSTQSQDLFQACLSFARQLSQSPGLYCRLEVKLGEKSLNFLTGSPGRRKSPSDYRRDQRRRTLSRRGLATPGNHGAVSVPPAVPIGGQTGHSASSSSPYKRSVPWSKHLFSPTNIPQLGRGRSFISEQGLDIQASTPSVSDLGPLVQNYCEFSQSNHLAYIQKVCPT